MKKFILFIVIILILVGHTMYELRPQEYFVTSESAQDLRDLRDMSSHYEGVVIPGPVQAGGTCVVFRAASLDAYKDYLASACYELEEDVSDVPYIEDYQKHVYIPESFSVTEHYRNVCVNDFRDYLLEVDSKGNAYCVFTRSN